MKNNECPICGTHGIKALYSVYSDELMKTLSVKKCETCKVCFTSPFISAEEIQDVCTRAYYKKDLSRLKHLFEDRIPIPWFQRKRNVERFREKGKILDIGCGNENFLSSFDRKKWEVHGVEISEESAKHALGKSIQMHIGDIATIDLPNDYFDVVSMWHVFEHCREPEKVLRQIYKSLKKEGMLVVAVPNIRSLQAEMFSGKWYHLDISRHLFHYSPEPLRRLFRRSYFRAIHENHFIMKNCFGFSQSVFDSMGFERNLFKNLVMGNKIKAGRVQVSLNILLLPLVVPVSILSCLIESSVRKGGTFEIYCVKEDH